MPAKLELSEQQLVQELKEANRKTEGQHLSMKKFNEEANISTATLIKKLDLDWSEALKKAGIPLHYKQKPQEKRKELILQDIRELAQQTDKLTGEYYDENGEYGLSTASKKFGSFSEAKEEAGLEPHHFQLGKLSEEQIINHIEKVYDSVKPVEKFYITYFEENSGYTAPGVINYIGEDSSWSTVLKHTKIPEEKIPGKGEKPTKSNTEELKSIMQEFEEQIRKHKGGRIYIKELEKETGYSLRGGGAGVEQLYNYLKEETDINAVNYTTGKKQESSIFIKNPLFERYQEELNKLEYQEQKNVFKQLISVGRKPHAIIAALKYLEDPEEKDQRTVSEQYGASTASIRSVRDKIQEMDETPSLDKLTEEDLTARGN